jgi:hypothetical protein
MVTITPIAATGQRKRRRGRHRAAGRNVYKVAPTFPTLMVRRMRDEGREPMPRRFPPAYEDPPWVVIVAYLLVLFGGLVIVGAAYGLWLLVTRIF